MTSGPAFHSLFPAAELPAGGSRVVKVDGRQVAVFRLADGALRACDNRCPHEGYPLADGSVKDGVLTCAWHNYKFALQDGRCLMGDEDLPVHEVRVEEGRVEVRVGAADRAASLPRHRVGLDQALLDRRTGQAAREITRLLAAGEPPAAIALAIAAFDARHGEYGTTHGTPAALEALALCGDGAPRQAVPPLYLAAEVASEGNVRLPPRALAAPIDPGDDAQRAGERVVDAIEAEDGPTAEGLVLGAFERGWPREWIQPWLYRVVTAHHLDIGHPLIYLVALDDLHERAGLDHARETSAALLHNALCATREDLLPAWAGFRSLWSTAGPELAALNEAARLRGAPADRETPWDLARPLVEGDPVAGTRVLLRMLGEGVPLDSVLDGISIGACARILRFDAALDQDPAWQDDWLDITHLLTFVDALRRASRRFPGWELLRSVGQAAWAVARHQPADGDDGLWWQATGRGSVPGSGDVQADLVAALGARDSAGAIGAARQVAAGTGGLARLADLLLGVSVDTPAVRPIFRAHLLKTAAAAGREARELAARGLAPLPLLAATRLLAAPLQEARAPRVVHEAIRFVVDGKVPRRRVAS